MRATDDGIWHECPEADYRGYLASFRRRDELGADPLPNETLRDDLRRGVWDGGAGNVMHFVFDLVRFERDPRHVRSESQHKVCWRVHDQHDGRWRFWVPTFWLMQHRGKNPRAGLRQDKQA